jgi:hypothetical protein
MTRKRLFNSLMFLTILATLSFGVAQAQPHPQTGDKDWVIHIISDASVKYSEALVPGWETVAFDDSTWLNVSAPTAGLCDPSVVTPIPDSDALHVWSQTPYEHQTIYARKTFILKQGNLATIKIRVDDDFDLFVNGVLVRSDWNGVCSYFEDDISALIRHGINVIATKATDSAGACQHLAFDVTIEQSKPYYHGPRHQIRSRERQ